MAHIHSVYDADMHFSIDPITRKISNAASKKYGIVQFDHNSERFTFKLPRYIEGHDMSLCNKTEVHYINIGAHGEKAEGVYPVNDIQISPADENVVICSWLISGNATKLAGTLSFMIRFACLTDNVVDYAWHTMTYTGFTISEGMNNGEAVMDVPVDVLAQWRNEIMADVEDAAKRAEAAAEHAEEAKLEIPRIGDNGNWFIGDTDTGIKAAGKDGKDGAPGEDGTDGITPHIGDNGNWFIGDTDTGVAAGGNGGVSSWNDLTDKPFGEVVETIEPITWDGNTEGLFAVILDEGYGFYKVSDRVFSNEQLRMMAYSKIDTNEDTGEPYEDNFAFRDEWDEMVHVGMIADDITALYGVTVVRKAGAVDIDGNVYQEVGTYFVKEEYPEDGYLYYITSLYVEGNAITTVKKIDEKYLEPFESIVAEDLLPSGVDQTFLHNIGVFAISSKTTEEMFWKWQEGIKGNVFVEFDGVTYECSPQRLAAMDNGMAVGNCTNFGGTGNGEPFIVTIMPDTDANGVATGAYYWAIAVLTDTAPTEHQYRVYQPYDEPKYMLKESHLPFDAIAAYIDNYIDEALGGDY